MAGFSKEEEAISAEMMKMEAAAARISSELCSAEKSGLFDYNPTSKF